MVETFTNPVYGHDCADPYALAFDGAFWVYHTGLWRDGRVFGVLRSTDLIHWEEAGGAMDPLPQGFRDYWAPEVTYLNGAFYLYYSAGDEETMHLRVATSDRPQGPFVDTGRELTREKFAIDAHVFTDTDGARYLFYATDFLDRERVGTGTVVDRMIDPLRLAVQPRPVSLARYDWHIFDPRRAVKGNVRWHTLEGPFVLKHKGRYYQMFSGGNYTNQSYGVGYVITDHIQSSVEWQHVIDGDHALPILRTVPGQVSGPGHNSVVTGPDHRQRYCVYHVIHPENGRFARVLALDRLEWVGDRMAVLGPTYTPQPMPLKARKLLETPLALKGTWSAALDSAAFLFHAWAKTSGPRGHFSVALSGASGDALRLGWDHGQLAISGPVQAALDLPRGFNLQALHCYEIEVNGLWAEVRVDGVQTVWKGRLASQPRRLALEGSGATFSTADLTRGYEDRFDAPERPPETLGWKLEDPSGLARTGLMYIAGRLLRGLVRVNTPLKLWKDLALENYEWVVNFQLAHGDSLSFFPAASADQPGLEVRLEKGSTGWLLKVGDDAAALPEDFTPRDFQQLRFWKQAGQLRVRSMTDELGAWPVSDGPTSAGFLIHAGSELALDLARMTEII